MSILLRAAAILTSLSVLAIGVFATVTWTGKGTGDTFCCCAPAHTANCTGVNLQHLASVKVDVNDGQGHNENAEMQPTNHTGTAMTNQTVTLGMCMYIEYTFTCEKVGGVWLCTTPTWTNIQRNCP